MGPALEYVLCFCCVAHFSCSNFSDSISYHFVL